MNDEPTPAPETLNRIRSAPEITSGSASNANGLGGAVVLTGGSGGSAHSPEAIQAYQQRLAEMREAQAAQAPD